MQTDIPDKSSVYDKNYVQSKIEAFLCSKPFIMRKLKKGKLYCDACGHPFPANLPMFIKIDDTKQQLLCVACNNIKLGINLEEQYKAERAKMGIMPEVKRQYKKKEEPVKKEKKAKTTNQVKLF